MDVKKEIEKLKIKLGEVGKNLQGSLDKVLKKKKASDESSPAEEDKTKPDNPNLSDIENKGEASNEDNKDSGDKKKDKKKKKHNFTEQDLKRKKIIQFIVVIAIAIFLFAEDEEVVQQVQNAVKENVKKIAGDGDPSGENDGMKEEARENIQADTSGESTSNEGGNENNFSDNNAPSSRNDLDSEENLDELPKVEKVVKSAVVEKDEDEELDFDFDIKPAGEDNVAKSEVEKEPKKSMLDIAKKIEKKAREESKRKEYKKVNYLKVGRGLAYNCKEKYWACLNKSEYFNCRDNKEHLELNKKPKECFPLEVYSSIRDCKIIQIHNINTLKKTDFCKGN